MARASFMGAWLLASLAIVALTGCTEQAAPPAKTMADAKPAVPPVESIAPTADFPKIKGPELKQHADTPKEHRKVLLGSPELTDGIPGDGDLTVADIKKWLADPLNHQVLDVTLPLGLATGQGQIKGLDKNPLTLAKIELGRQLYFDPRLSADETISCASCHDPDEGFAAHTQFGLGIRGQLGGRNSPVSYNRILSDSQFWDGRAPSLEAQAIGPIANPIEMGHTHKACIDCLQNVEGYKLQFDAIFTGEPMAIEHVGKAIAAFERVIVTGPSPFDYHERFASFSAVDPDDLKKDDPDEFKAYEKAKADSEAHKMSESAVRGQKVYFSDKGACSACHVGANLTDEQYHNLGIGMDAKEPDLGRFTETKVDKDKGAFKTPTIRNVALSAPYMHDGSLKTLEQVIDLYDKGGHANPHLDPKIKKLNLSAQDKADLLAFMQACTGDFPKIQRGRLPK